MSGLQLQVLSNPTSSESSSGSSAPSFIIGNPQVRKRRKKRGLVKNARKRENGSMSKRRRHSKARHKKSRHHRRHRKNPFEQVMKKGKHTHKVVGLTPAEQAKANRTVKYEISVLRRLKAGKPHPMREKAIAKQMSKLKQLLKMRHLGRVDSRKARAELKRLKAQGYRTGSAKKVSYKSADRTRSSGSPSRKSSKRPYGIIGRENGYLLIKKKDGSIRRVKIKSRGKRKAAKKSSSRKSFKRRKKTERRKTQRRGRIGFIKSNRKGYRAIRLKSGRIKYIKMGGKRKNPKRRRKHARRKASRKHRKNPARRHRARHARRKRTHRKHRARKNPGVRQHKSRKHRKHRKNPLGGTMGKALNFLTAGDPKEASYILAAAAVSEPLAALALKVPGLGSVLGSLNSALSGISPKAAMAIVPILPNVLVAIAAEAVGQKTGKKSVQEFGKALMITNIVDLGEALGSMLASSAGLAGVSYTPMGKKRRGMRGVDFTPRSPMGAVPRGLGSYLPSPGGTLSTSADFGAVPHGMRGLTSRDHADFGRQMADFGGVDFTMSAVPSLRGAHTGDREYSPSDDQPGSDDDQLNESSDHTV